MFFKRKPKTFAEARDSVLKILRLPGTTTDEEIFKAVQKAIDKRNTKVLKLLDGKLEIIIKHFQDKKV